MKREGEAGAGRGRVDEQNTPTMAPRKAHQEDEGPHHHHHLLRDHLIEKKTPPTTAALTPLLLPPLDSMVVAAAPVGHQITTVAHRLIPQEGQEVWITLSSTPTGRRGGGNNDGAWSDDEEEDAMVMQEDKRWKLQSDHDGGEMRGFCGNHHQEHVKEEEREVEEPDNGRSCCRWGMRCEYRRNGGCWFRHIYL